MQIENNKDKIDYYQSVGTKLTVTAKCRDQNDVSSLYINGVNNRSYVYNKKKKKKSSKVNIIGKKKKASEQCEVNSSFKAFTLFILTCKELRPQ